MLKTWKDYLYFENFVFITFAAFSDENYTLITKVVSFWIKYMCHFNFLNALLKYFYDYEYQK